MFGVASSVRIARTIASSKSPFGMAELAIGLVEQPLDVDVGLRRVRRAHRDERARRRCPSGCRSPDRRGRRTADDAQPARRPQRSPAVTPASCRRRSARRRASAARTTPLVARSRASMGWFESVATRSRSNVSESSSGGRSSCCRCGRLEPSATSVAVVGAGTAAAGCARLIHHSARSAPAITAPAPRRTQRVGDGHVAAVAAGGSGGSGRWSGRSSKAMAALLYDGPRPVPAFEPARVDRLDGDVGAGRQRRQHGFGGR